MPVAATERAISAALGLSSRTPLDPAEVDRRLADPTARAAAQAVAPTGSAAAAALASSDPGAGDALVRALESGAAAESEALRREAASLRADDAPLAIPPARRAVVARYLSSRAVAPAPAK